MQPFAYLCLQDGAIQVMSANPLYGDNPYTVQPRGCGERGEYIHITPDFAANMDGLSAVFGPTG